MAHYNIPLRDPNISKGFGVRYGEVYKPKEKTFLPISHSISGPNLVKLNIQMSKAGITYNQLL